MGFVGTETERYFQKKNVETIGYDLADGFDIRNPSLLEKVIQDTKPNHILHLAAIARFADADADPYLAHETNVLGTRNVAIAANKYRVPVIYASTGSVYMPIEQAPPITEDFPVRGNSVYGVTKALGELYIARHAGQYIILRYAHLYGKEKRHHGLVGSFITRIERGLAPILYGGQQSNDFTYIYDIARANYLALTASSSSWNQVYNIGTGEELSAKDASNIICELMDYTDEVEIKEERKVDPQRFVYNTEKAQAYLGFQAEYSFKEGLQHMLSTP